MFYLGVEFYETTTFTEFVHLVKCKMGLPEESKVSLTYQHPEQLYYCGIVDDRDIRKLIKVINIVGDKSVYVYVVVEEGLSRNEVDDRGKASAANLSSGKGSNTLIGNFKSPSKSQYHSVAENENVLPEPIMYVTPENYKYIGENDVGTYVNDVSVNHNFDQKKHYTWLIRLVMNLENRKFRFCMMVN